MDDKSLPSRTYAAPSLLPRYKPSVPRPQPSSSESKQVGVISETPSPMQGRSSRSVVRRQFDSNYGGEEFHRSAVSEMSEVRATRRTSASVPGRLEVDESDSIFGIAFPDPAMPRSQSRAVPSVRPRPRNVAQVDDLPPTLIPELQALATASRSSDSRHPTLSPGNISSPSTQYTDSPGPWSSRNTTPTSMSSYSSSVIQPLRPVTSRRPSLTSTKTISVRPTIDTEVDATKRLSVVPEALTSSSSASTAQETRTPPESTEKKHKRRPLTPPAPTPPPRTSSVKHKSSSSKSLLPAPSTLQSPIRQNPFYVVQNAREPFS